MRNKNFPNTSKFLDKFIVTALNNTINHLKKQGLTNSRLIKELAVDYQFVGNNILFEFSKPDYAIFVDQGRRPGKQPPINSILGWIARKNLTPRDGISFRALAFLIARKIGLKGMKARPFIKFMESQFFSKEFVEGLNKEMAKDLHLQIIKELKKI